MADKKTTTQAAEQAALDPPAAVRNDIPLLTEKDIECRVQSVSRAKTGRVGAVLLLYKDARVDMRTVVLRDYGFDYSGRRETVERIRKRRCINGNPEKLSAEGEWE